MVLSDGLRIGHLNFCRICEKCHECCPPKSIPNGDRVEISFVNSAVNVKLDDALFDLANPSFEPSAQNK